jgi:hypothetical protein
MIEPVRERQCAIRRSAWYGSWVPVIALASLCVARMAAAAATPGEQIRYSAGSSSVRAALPEDAALVLGIEPFRGFPRGRCVFHLGLDLRHMVKPQLPVACHLGLLSLDRHRPGTVRLGKREPIRTGLLPAQQTWRNFGIQTGLRIAVNI